MQHSTSREFAGLGAPDVALTFAATDTAVRRALCTVRQALRAHDVNDLTLGSVEIVLAEACNNIVEHAYDAPQSGIIELIARHCNGLVIIELSDSGRAMPRLALPEKKSHDLTAGVGDLPEGGFGWGLIRDMTTSLIYQRQGDRNLLRMTIATQQ